MNRNDFFLIEDTTFNIEGIDILVKFTRYKARGKVVFLDGLELAEDLTTESGTILYTKGTKITPQKISRLLMLHESKPGMELVFKINRTTKIIQKFRNEVKDQINKGYKRLQSITIYKNLLSNIEEKIEDYIDDILSDENLIMALYKIKFISDSSDSKRSELFFNHTLNVMFISLAVASLERYTDHLGKHKAILIDLCKVGLFHNYGALTRIDNIFKAEKDKIFYLYWDENLNGCDSLGILQLKPEIMEAIQFICEYHLGVKNFIESRKWPATMANIVLVTEMFLRKNSRLFGKPQDTREVIDRLNVLMMEKELNEMAVQSLTLGLNLIDIFDFYKELNHIMGKCPYDYSGVPYPLTGFKGPSLFVCKNERNECRHIESSLYAVDLQKSMRTLGPGKYRRCWLLSHMLSAFYKTYYSKQKNSTSD